MKIALDPFMHRHLGLEELPFRVKEIGFDWIELSPRGDFLEWFKAPRVFPERVRGFRRALKEAGVEIASLLPMYRWASNDEDERKAAVRHWKRAIEICLELEVDTMNSEFGRGPHPDKGACYCCHTGSMIEACEDSWWRSMEELVPVFEREGINSAYPVRPYTHHILGAAILPNRALHRLVLRCHWQCPTTIGRHSSDRSAC